MYLHNTKSIQLPCGLLVYHHLIYMCRLALFPGLPTAQFFSMQKQRRAALENGEGRWGWTNLRPCWKLSLFRDPPPLSVYLTHVAKSFHMYGIHIKISTQDRNCTAQCLGSMHGVRSSMFVRQQLSVWLNIDSDTSMYGCLYNHEPHLPEKVCLDAYAEKEETLTGRLLTLEQN